MVFVEFFKITFLIAKDGGGLIFRRLQYVHMQSGFSAIKVIRITNICARYPAAVVGG